MDVAIWTLVHIFAEGKFISLLSVVFGAGIFLMAQRLEERTAHPERAYYRRMAGLLLIGAVHAYLFWSGDILVSYAICGACAYPLRRLRPRTLLLVAGSLLLAGSAMEVVAPYYLAPIFLSYGSSLMRSLSPWTETADYSGNWITEMAARVPMAVQTETYALVSSTFWRVAGLMAAGMAFAKLGFFRCSAKKSSLLWVALAGCLLGVAVAYAGAILHKLFGWQSREGMLIDSQLSYWASLAIAAGYGACILLMTHNGIFVKASQVVAAVGRTALSNYLLQTLTCTTIFYGHGFGLFGQVHRPTQMAIVLSIWVAEAALSVAWLKPFRFGPAEWLLRVITYWRSEPMRCAPAGGN
jgi:uncharacterized protein